MPDTSVVPTGFWPQIDHQLERIATAKPDTYDGVRAILLDLDYDAIVIETHRNGPRPFNGDEAFFAGSGGDASLLDALANAGWQTTVYRASYYCVLVHEITSETLTYIEGDVQRGDLLSNDS